MYSCYNYRSEKVKELTNGKENSSEVKKEEDGSEEDDDRSDVDEVYNEDNSACVFDRKSQKLLFVLNSENCFYRKLALTRGKQSHKAVSRRKHGDFNR